MNTPKGADHQNSRTTENPFSLSSLPAESVNPTDPLMDAEQAERENLEAAHWITPFIDESMFSDWDSHISSSIDGASSSAHAGNEVDTPEDTNSGVWDAIPMSDTIHDLVNDSDFDLEHELDSWRLSSVVPDSSSFMNSSSCQAVKLACTTRSCHLVLGDHITSDMTSYESPPFFSGVGSENDALSVRPTSVGEGEARTSPKDPQRVRGRRPNESRDSDPGRSEFVDDGEVGIAREIATCDGR